MAVRSPTGAGGVVVDPRIQARRDAVAREARRRRRNQVAVAAALVLVALCLYGVTRSSLLDVDRVQVVGGASTGADAIRAAAGIRPGDQMVDLDLDAARARLEALPWVRSARLARAWPGTVRIVVSERRAVARVADPAGGWWLVDGSGRLLAIVPTPPEGLVEVAGVVTGGQPGAQLSRRASVALGLIAQMPAEVAARTVGLRLGPDDLVGLVVRGGAGDVDDDVEADAAAGSAGGTSVDGALGPDVPAPYAMALLTSGERSTDQLGALDAVLTQVDDRCLAAVDVRVPDKPVVTRRANCR